ncbi:MAG TPA: FAD-dependent oxidoreductase [Myxococcaceae bacterium]|nr:FAD-dependent oxidoreductase [Myxococcaceae bacterium]
MKKAHRRPTVAVLGGGVGGLSAAHELAERGFAVTVYEAAPGLGGKARSIFVPGTGKDGRRDLPGEHGFRFFPSFYRHLPDTMKRIPFGRNPNGVFDNLTATSRTRICRVNAPALDVITRFPSSLNDLNQLLRTIVLDDVGLPWQDVAFVSGLFMMLLTTCPERRMAEHEHAPWWDFIEAERRSPAFRRYFADIAVRSLVAMCPRKANTRTIGTIGMQIWIDHARPGTHVDRLLDGPTQDAWITPWVQHLRRLGVAFHFGARVVGIDSDGARVAGVTVVTPRGPVRVTADHYVAALPVERMRPLVTEAMKGVDPGLGGLDQLATEWMTGVQFFLDVPLPIVSGHVVLADSPWAVTAISQAQFWPRTDLRRFGDGRVRGVLSAIIANWDAPGTYVGKPARECSAQEIREELWRQLQAHLGGTGAGGLPDRHLVDWYLADSIEFRDGRPHNREPLLINTAGSWRHRPDAVTRLENLFLAADYVRTHTDLATMESANEAARRATNGILAATGVAAAPCQIWPLEEPSLFRRLQHLDRRRFRSGEPHLLAPSLAAA